MSETAISTARTSEEYIAALAGRYATPQDMVLEQGIAEAGLEADVDSEAGDDDE